METLFLAQSFDHAVTYVASLLGSGINGNQPIGLLLLNGLGERRFLIRKWN